MNLRLLACLALAFALSAAAQYRQETSLDKWEFSRDNVAWQQVNIPHDWAIAGPFERPMDEDGREAECLWLTPDVVLGEVRHWQRTVRWGGGLAAGLALGLAAVTLACIQLLGVRERRTEIGLRRALGATRGEVAGLFFLESVGLALIAALVAGAALLLLRGWLAEVLPFPLRFTAGTWVGPLAIAIALVGVCSALPAHAAAGIEPAAGVRE